MALLVELRFLLGVGSRERLGLLLGAGQRIFGAAGLIARIVQRGVGNDARQEHAADEQKSDDNERRASGKISPGARCEQHGGGNGADQYPCRGS